MIVLGEGPPQELNGTTVRADATNILLIFQDHKENLILDFIIIEGTVFFFVSDTKIYQSNAKNSAIEPYALCLGNISKDFTANDMKKNSIKWICVRFFC